jgi:hypothetical protein
MGTPKFVQPLSRGYPPNFNWTRYYKNVSIALADLRSRSGGSSAG